MMSTFETLTSLLILVAAFALAVPAIEKTIEDGIDMFRELKEANDIEKAKRRRHSKG